MSKKTTPLAELLVTEAVAVDKTGSKESAVMKILLERYRYQQDCRKRALDLASMEASRFNPATSLTAQQGKEVEIIQLADKYYNWLISIPNDK